MKKNIILVLMTLAMMFSHCAASSYALVEDAYTAKYGDSLNSIALTYMSKNTYGAREFKEFKAGIIELNPWLLERDIRPGDKVRINYWVEVEEN
jgi:hypothetical protein